MPITEPPSRFFLPGSFQHSVPELVDISHFVTWLNSDAPEKLLVEMYGASTPQELKKCQEIFEMKQVYLKSNIGTTDVVRDIVNPLAGADLTSAFLFGADKAILCDMAPFFYDSAAKTSAQDKVVDAYSFMQNVLKETRILTLMFGISYGSYDNLKDYNQGFTGTENTNAEVGSYPPGYLGLIRLKFLLGAEDIQITRSDKNGWEIKFNVNEKQHDGVIVKKSKQINYFDKTYFPDMAIKKTTEQQDTSAEFISYVAENNPGTVLFKGSHDFPVADASRSFWKAVGENKTVYTDDLSSSTGQAREKMSSDFNDRVTISFDTLEKGLPFDEGVVASRFGYGRVIQKYLSNQFVNLFEKKDSKGFHS